MENKLPKIAAKHSMKVNVEKDKIYSWCSCGMSQNQPFCDGSHKGSGFAPVMYKAEEDKLVGFCGCKMSELAPICDGAHKKL